MTSKYYIIKYIRNYSGTQFIYRTGYNGHDKFNVQKDIIVTIKNGKYRLEKISKDETIISHKYDNIALTDAITVYSSEGAQRNFFYTDTIYNDKYFKGKIGDKWYLHSLSTGEKVIDKGYDRLYLINENTIAVYENGHISFIDYKGNYISDDKIEVYISSQRFYNSPEGIRFVVKDNIVSIYVDIEGTSQNHEYEYNLQTKKVTAKEWLLTDNCFEEIA